MASPICFRLLAQLIRLAASRTRWTAGRRRPIKIEMMAMTTSSSIRVNPGRPRRLHMRHLLRLLLGNTGVNLGRGDLEFGRLVRPEGGARQLEPEPPRRAGWRVEE